MAVIRKNGVVFAKHCWEKSESYIGMYFGNTFSKKYFQCIRAVGIVRTEDGFNGMQCVNVL